MEAIPIESTETFAADGIVAGTARQRRNWRRIALPATLVGVIVLAAFVGPMAVKSPQTQNLRYGDLPPIGFGDSTGAHLLGTDAIGRDILARTVFGLRSSIETAALALVVAAFFGVAVGLLAGYVGGWLDDLIMRVVDVQLAIPTIMLLLLVVSIFEPSFVTVVGTLALLAWVVYVRTTRAEVLALKQQEMVTALIALGIPTRRLLVRHVLPNVAGPLIVVTTIEFASLITAGAALSYLGLGIPPPAPTLGGMIEDGQTGMTGGLWWPVVVPAVTLALLILIIGVLSDRLRAYLDPRSRTSRQALSLRRR